MSTEFFTTAARVYATNRDLALPEVYVVAQHKKAPNFGDLQGKIYVALINTSAEGLRAMHEFVHHTSIPEGTGKGIQTSGFLKLRHGDCLLATSKEDPGEDDTHEMICWITPEGCLTSRT
ncbi:hypothetical protein BD413DRAFT_596698 [Trametes elegans]|nr:hypothetical protein BD413DRAFT_596698 [Trametes elegans]